MYSTVLFSIFVWQCRLLLQIVSARNVPVRASEEASGGLSMSPTAARQKMVGGGGGASPGSDSPKDDDFEVRYARLMDNAVRLACAMTTRQLQLPCVFRIH